MNALQYQIPKKNKSQIPKKNKGGKQQGIKPLGLKRQYEIESQVMRLTK